MPSMITKPKISFWVNASTTNIPQLESLVSNWQSLFVTRLNSTMSSNSNNMSLINSDYRLSINPVHAIEPDDSEHDLYELTAKIALEIEFPERWEKITMLRKLDFLFQQTQSSLRSAILSGSGVSIYRQFRKSSTGKVVSNG